MKKSIVATALVASYFGVKHIYATSMNRQAYNEKRGWTVPEDENPSDEGYMVESVDSPNPNTNFSPYYVSWSPKDIFDAEYRPIDGMTFGIAIEMLKKGEKVARKGWNGKGMFIILVNGTNNVKPYDGTPYKEVCDFKGKTEINILPHIDMYSATDEMVVGWLASQTDMLAEDWVVVV